MQKLRFASGGVLKRGFALPTVLIASVVLLTMLAVAVGSVNAARVVLQNQYYNQLSKEAAEAGLQMARACIEDGYMSWTDPLRPGGDCYGLSTPCTGDDCYVMNANNNRTTFVVTAPTITGDVSTIRAAGTTERVRATSGEVWKTYTKQLNMQDMVTDVNPGVELSWRGVSSGYNHTCALAPNDKAYCWGGAGGQLGNGTTTASLTPVAVSQGAIPSGVTIQQVSAGTNYTCALASNNQVYCWGYNYDGQLGNGTTTTSLTPVAVSQGAIPSGVTIRQISAGSGHTCAVASNNQAYCWGGNASGQLGNNSTTQSTIPVAVSQGAIPSGMTIRQISASTTYTCAIASNNNQVYCWGGSSAGQLGNGTTTTSLTPVAVSQGAIPSGVTMQDIVVGINHACTLGSNNQVYCWGVGGGGQLGNGATANATTPVAVSQGAIPAGLTIQGVTAGGYHTCAIASNNQAYCWGNGGSGRLGNGATANATTPVAVSQGAIPAGLTIQGVTAGNTHTCALASSGQVYCWGDGSSGRLGSGTTATTSTPVATSSVYDKTQWPYLKQVEASYNHTCAISSNAKAYCWGPGGLGALGNGTTADMSVPTAVAQGAIPTNVSIQRIAVGGYHTCGIGTDNWVYCWGQGTAGQLGGGTNTNSLTPVAVSQGAIPAGVTIRQISAGTHHTCAVASNGRTYCWGTGGSGRLGNGTTANSLTPVAVSQGAIPAGVTIKQISAGSMHTCGIGSNKRVYCWGQGVYGQLGNGTTATSLTPVAVSQGAIPAGVTIKQISTAGNHTCAIGSNNLAYCWGYGGSSQLGNGATANATTPVAVSQGAIPAGVTIRQISAGSSHTCAIGSNNLAYCWGYNTPGYLGSGTNITSATPVAVSQGAIPAGVTIKQISVGGVGDSHTCTVASNNRSYCWGSGLGGRLGNGSTADTNTNTPVAVSQGAIPFSTVAMERVAIGGVSTCALSTSGQAYCWGQGTAGQLGGGTNTNSLTPVAVSQGAIPAGVTIRQISAGSSHTCAIGSNNLAYCWGVGSGGQLGNSSTTNSPTPVAVSQGAIPAGVTIRQISAGGSHTCVIASNNLAYCWGHGANGRLGNGTTATSPTPVAVSQGAIPAGVTIRQISAGGSHTCVIASNNLAYCWGVGQLGNGTTQSSTPVAVSQGAIPAGVTIRQISAGGSHTCVIASNNLAYCWGMGIYGRIGDNTTVQRTTPVAVQRGGMPVGYSVRQISAGATHTCAVASDNKSYCWGEGTDGRLGDNTSAQRNIPTAVSQGAIPAGVTARDIATASLGTHVCMTGSDNQVYCWGSNDSGQLGDGSVNPSPLPVSANSVPGSVYTPDYLLLGPRRYF